MPDLAGLLEIVAVATGFVCVWLTIRQNIWTWPITIVSSLLFGLLFFDAQLYGTMGLQALFIIIAIYGWRSWLRAGPDGGQLQVSKITLKIGIVLLTVTAIGIAILFFGLIRHTASPYPLPDSVTTVLSISASWMAARKILESWLVWIITDVIYVGLYITSELYLTCLLYAVYLAMAVGGYISWRRNLPTNEVAPQKSPSISKTTRSA